MLMKLIEKVCDVFSKNEDKIIIKNNKKTHRYSSSKYVTKTIEFDNKNVIYPDNTTEKEIENLYSEIRESIEKNRNKINKHKLTYNL